MVLIFLPVTGATSTTKFVIGKVSARAAAELLFAALAGFHTILAALLFTWTAWRSSGGGGGSEKGK